VIVAACLLTLGLVVVVESRRLGAGWDYNGPQSGYFPFYIGLLIVGSSLATILVSLFGKGADRAIFVEPERFRLVLRVLIPAIIFVAAIPFIGIYVAGGLFIAFFMWWLGKYSVLPSLLVGAAVPFCLFLMFDVWFLIALPKGPIEALFGY
jgi:hypothetical protein